MAHDPDAYDRDRDEPDNGNLFLEDDYARRDWLDAICGVSEPWHDLCSEGFPANGR